MFFKNIRLFELTSPINSSALDLTEKLKPLAFKPCLPSIPTSMGWAPPLDEEHAPLVRGINGCLMLCLQIEEKILPSSVVTHTLKDKVKQIEAKEARKVRQKEKLSLKDDLIQTLLPRAFSKYTQIFGYIDTRYGWLIINSTSPKKVELFLNLFKKTLGDGVEEFELNKPSTIITHWVKTQEYPEAFSIEKACTMQDPQQQNRMIKCQHQDLFVPSIQSLVKEGCEIIQLALCWHDRLVFSLTDDFTFRSIRLADGDLEIQEEIETKQQKFDADFLMMTEMFSGLLKDILGIFDKNFVEKGKAA